ncbi:CBD9-like protein [Xylariaceae sp. FL0016]|nr:CBD9-like protein [Xylariaceae sp. FL0016]
MSLPQNLHLTTLLLLISILALATPSLCDDDDDDDEGGTKQTAAFTDPATGIPMQRFFGAASGFGFGIALPTNVTDSFIGQLSFPLTAGAGWGGWSLTGDMEGPLLMAAWSDGTSVVSSFRQAFNEDDNPPEVTGSFSVRPIAQGTSVNDTALTYTFLCAGCLDASLGLGAAATGATVEMGWAMGSQAVQDPGTSAGVLAFHDVGFGGFDAHLDQARTADFDTFAAMAGDPLVASAGAQPIQANAGSDDEGDAAGGATSGGGTVDAGADSDSEDD